MRIALKYSKCWASQGHALFPVVLFPTLLHGERFFEAKIVLPTNSSSTEFPERMI